MLFLMLSKSNRWIIIGSVMHLLRVWRTGPMVAEQTAPLVDPAAAPTGPLALPPSETAPPRPSTQPQRPIWPPPDTPVGALGGADVAGAARVACAVHTGDSSQLRFNDLAGAAKVGAAASKAWPPSSS